MIKTLLAFLKFYFKLAGLKFFLAITLMITAVAFEGLGLSLFLPILQGEDSDSRITAFIQSGFDLMGLEYSLGNLLVFLVGFFFVRSVFMGGQSLVVAKILADLLVKLRCRLTEKMFHLKYQAFLGKPSGYLNNALMVEFPRVVSSFQTFCNLLVAVLFTVLYLAIPIFLNPLLIMVMAVVGIPFLLIIGKINKLTKDYSVMRTVHSAALQKIFIQSLNCYKYLKATAEYPSVLRQIVSQSKALGKLQLRHKVLETISRQGFEPFVIIVIAGIIYYYVGFQGKDILEISFLLYLLYSAMNRSLALQGNLIKLLSEWGSINILQSLEKELETLKEVRPPVDTREDLSADGSVKFRKVSFAFDNQTNILTDINIEILANTTVAFVGESGAGKTTMVNMLVGLLRPTQGEIFKGPVPYAEIYPEQLRKGIGYITQESVIFNDTVCNNITLWDKDSTGEKRQRVRKVAAQTHIAEFVEGLVHGYDTILGEGGINISGGQRQRICIARELYKEADMLIFDEATSSLDTKTEKAIQKNIDEFKGQKTVVIIAHRLSTVRNVDKIFVLKHGTVVEDGPYEELYAAGGEFRRMVDQQNG